MNLPRSDIKPNTYEYETEPLVTPNGFREYDARWLFGSEINLLGIEALGLGLGTFFQERGVKPRVATGHDYRSYSLSIKKALTVGLLRAGCQVVDIGMVTTPISYFAQFALDCPCVAMVTASHNENGWTGVKMGAERPLTFGPDEMARLKEIVLGGKGVAAERRNLVGRGGHPRALSRSDHRGPQTCAADARRGRLRKRHGGRLRAGSLAPHRRGSHRSRLQSRLHVSQLQSQYRRHEDAPRDGRRRARAWRRYLNRF